MLQQPSSNHKGANVGQIWSQNGTTITVTFCSVWLIELTLEAIPCVSLLRSMSVPSSLIAAASPSWPALCSENLRVLTRWLLFAKQRRSHGKNFNAQLRLETELWRAAIVSRCVRAGVKTDGASLRHRWMTWNISACSHLVPHRQWVWARTENRKSLPSVVADWSLRFLRWNVGRLLGGVVRAPAAGHRG